ncbi:MAG: hypothetical protein U9R58_11225 [Chloroflexota bacterium]|nr:hypothetical protein [Chloroflexota bacterium]
MVDGTSLSDRTVIAHSIHPRVYELLNTHHCVASNQWLIDDITIAVMPDALIRGSLMLGAEITVKKSVRLQSGCTWMG